jgi:hypothetical protein
MKCLWKIKRIAPRPNTPNIAKHILWELGFVHWGGIFVASLFWQKEETTDMVIQTFSFRFTRFTQSEFVFLAGKQNSGWW